jgi:pimeloyl-ACP methyl ester carboxylesterase
VNDITIDNAGVALAASVYGPPGAPPVLFLHGISNARDTWFDWAMQFSDRYRVYTLDFRGHGHSARATRYTLQDYISDAAAVLAHIGEPTLVVGHSLGGVVAGAMSVQGHPLVRAALLVDPAWFFGDPAEFEQTVYPKRFALLIRTIERLRAESAPLARWIETVAQTPHPLGGVFANHTPMRQIVSHASALQRQDLACWTVPVPDTFGGIDTSVPFRRPTWVIQADSSLGAALLDHQAGRIGEVNADGQATTDAFSLLHYSGSDHFPHRTTAFAERFGGDLERFVATFASDRGVRPA